MRRPNSSSSVRRLSRQCGVLNILEHPRLRKPATGDSFFSGIWVIQFYKMRSLKVFLNHLIHIIPLIITVIRHCFRHSHFHPLNHLSVTFSHCKSLISLLLFPYLVSLWCYSSTSSPFAVIFLPPLPCLLFFYLLSLLLFLYLLSHGCYSSTSSCLFDLY